MVKRAGLAPGEKSSGNHAGQAAISRRGRPGWCCARRPGRAFAVYLRVHRSHRLADWIADKHGTLRPGDAVDSRSDPRPAITSPADLVHD